MTWEIDIWWTNDVEARAAVSFMQHAPSRAVNHESTCD